MNAGPSNSIQSADLGAVTVLLYHQVGTVARPWSDLDCLCSRKALQDHLRILRQLPVRVVTAGQAAKLKLEGPCERDGWPLVVITFDDGDVSLLDHALPLLQEQGFPATVFAVVGELGRRAWWPRDPRNRMQLMNAAQLRFLQGCGIEVASHSMSHRKLTELDDRSLQRELSESRAKLEDALGTEVRSFAYPHGRVDSRVVAAVRAAGYQEAYVTDSRGTRYRCEERLVLPRNYVTWHDDADSVAYLLRRSRAPHIAMA